jgi:hypothetical protein
MPSVISENVEDMLLLELMGLIEHMEFREHLELINPNNSHKSKYKNKNKKI